MRTVLTIPLASAADRLLAARRARELAALVGLDARAQAQLSGAVADVVESATDAGEVDFAVSDDGAPLAVSATVRGLRAGTLHGDADPDGGGGLDLDRLRALADHVAPRVDGDGVGATVRLTWQPSEPGAVAAASAGEIAVTLQAAPVAVPDASMDELRRRNAELVQTLAALQARERELLDLNRELEDTNAGIAGLLREVDQSSAELRRHAEARTRFLRTVSHDLRTPLYAARGLLEELALADGLSGQSRDDVALLEGTVQEALDLVNDQLDLARVEAGRAVVRLTTVDVEDLFGQLRGTLRVLRRSAAVSLTFAGADGVAPLQTDTARLIRVLRNLVGNALKFTESGAVHVSARTVDDGRAVAFQVADTGVGIADEHLDRIFEDFVQVDGHADGHPDGHGQDGSGLGLPLAQRITAVLGGTLRVASIPGKGSTFTVTIPVRFTPPADLEGIEVVQTAEA